MSFRRDDAALRRRLSGTRDGEDALRHAGYSLTRQRRAVLDILERTRGAHPAAHDIFLELKGRYPRASLNTVYLTLRALEGIGKVAGRRWPNSPARFDARVERHVDVLCARCGAFEERMPEGSSYECVVVSAMAEGVCRACSAGVPSKGAA